MLLSAFHKIQKLPKSKYKISVLKDFCKINTKVPLPESFFNKVAGLRPATSFKKKLQHRRFPVNIETFSGTPFFRVPLMAASTKSK